MKNNLKQHNKIHTIGSKDVQRRKICLFSGDITRSGGTEKISILLANELARKNYEVYFVSISENNSEPYFKIDENIKRYSLFGKNVSLKLFLLPAIFKLHRFLRKNKIDVLIDIDVILSLISIFAVRFTRCRQISWEHFHFHENLGCKIRDTARKLAKKYADAIVVLTRTDKKQYLETPSKAPVFCIHNAVILPEMMQPKKFGSKTILSVGRLAYQKGFERIPALAERIFAKFPDWKWIIVGDGEKREEITAETEKRKLQNNLILAGVKNPFNYYPNAEFLVAVSRYEGMPLVLLEALSCQCPVISFDCPHGPADIVKNDENGYLIEAENFDALEKAILNMMSNPEICSKLSAQADKSIRDFSVEKFVNSWQMLIENEAVY